jgi:hypothetical protein
LGQTLPILPVVPQTIFLFCFFFFILCFLKRGLPSRDYAACAASSSFC